MTGASTATFPPRFWLRLGAETELTWRGYFPELTARDLSYYPNVLSAAQAQERACIALLGEPGTGKSSELARIFAETSGLKLHVDLSSHASEARVISELFEAPEVRAWKNADGGAGVLSLFIDSIDECRLYLPSIDGLLLSQLRKLPCDRLRLRVACRNADWAEHLEEGLISLFGHELCAQFELAPLRRSDVMAFARQREVDGNALCLALERVDLVSMAIHPITLPMVCDDFAAGSIATSRVDAYERAVRRLLVDPNKRRRGPAAKRVDVAPLRRAATRIAAQLVFGGRRGLRVLATPAPQAAELQVEDVLGDSSELKADDVVQASATALFSPRGGGCVGLVHQTYAEFLAARFLVDELTEDQSWSLLVATDASGCQRILPQLAEVAAWASAMSRTLGARLVAADPAGLVRSAAAGLSADLKALLVPALLDTVEATGRWWVPGDRLRLHVLRHPSLEAQLRPYIMGTNGTRPECRRMAIEIAEECNLTDLTDELLVLAVSQEDRAIAELAIRALAPIIVNERARELFALANADGAPLTLDTLGIVVRRLWPAHLSTLELLSLLRTPDPHHVGAYRFFVRDQLPRRLETVDLAALLDWLRTHDAPDFERLELAAVRSAYARVAERPVAAALALLLEARFQRHSRSSYRELAIEPASRRALIATVAERGCDDPHHVSFGLNDLGLLKSEDFLWYLERALETTGPSKAVWLSIAFTCFNVELPEHAEAALAAREADPAAHEAFSNLDPWDLNNRHVVLRREQRFEEIRRLRASPAAACVRQRLDEIEGGNLDSWCHLITELSRELDVDEYDTHDEFSSDITQMRGWAGCDHATRNRCVTAAVNYLQGATSPPLNRSGRHIPFNREGFAGLRALRLLQDLAPAVLDSLPAVMWARWAKWVIGGPPPVLNDSIEQRGSLLDRCLKFAPTEVRETIEECAREELEAGEFPAILSLFEGPWPTFVVSLVEGFLREREVSDRALPGLIEELLVQKPSFLSHAIRIATEAQTDPGRREVAVALFALLVRLQFGGFPSELENGLRDEAFAQEVFLAIARQDYGSRTDFAALSESALGGLYERFRRVFAPEADPHLEGTHRVSPRESVGRYRDLFRRELEGRGTAAAVAELERLGRQFPDATLEYALVQGQHNFLRNQWRSLAPGSLLELAQDRRHGFVRSSQDLLRLVLDSLDRFQARLHGETPAVPDLWDEAVSTRPKSENALSDRIKRHLDDDLSDHQVVVNREVEIRRGSETDIHVAAVGEAPTDRATVIVEVKGCWNQHLCTDLTDQLAGRYLKESPLACGIYVVGWFTCDRWSADDYRRDATPHWTLAEARAFFANQAGPLARTSSIVLDVHLPVSSAPRSGRKAAAQATGRKRRAAAPRSKAPKQKSKKRR